MTVKVDVRSEKAFIDVDWSVETLLNPVHDAVGKTRGYRRRAMDFLAAPSVSQMTVLSLHVRVSLRWKALERKRKPMTET